MSPDLFLRDHITMLSIVQGLKTVVSSGGASPVLVTPSYWEEELSHGVLICLFQMFIIHDVLHKRQNLCLTFCCSLSNVYDTVGHRIN